MWDLATTATAEAASASEWWQTVLLGAGAGAVVSFFLTPVVSRRVNREASDGALISQMLDELRLVRECFDYKVTIQPRLAAERALEGWIHLRRAGTLGSQLSPVYNDLQETFETWMDARPDQDAETRLIGVHDGLMGLDDLPQRLLPDDLRTTVVAYHLALGHVRGRSWHAYWTRLQRWRLQRAFANAIDADRLRELS